jgi:sialate O-acetylesterase
VTGFEVAGSDGKFSPASARIDGETIIASSPSVSQPVYVRYGWANSPVCNLFNGEGLPASPFISMK